jgi:AGCS family alanine or glycine:cation symporter
LFHFLNPNAESAAQGYNGTLTVTDGVVEGEITLLHARSVAENVTVTHLTDGLPWSGELTVENGRVFNNDGDVQFEGESLLHSAPLTTIAFGRGLLGDLGTFIIPISLLLFAFSTAIAWSYYGDRAVTFLWGVKYVRYYRMLYVAGFFVAAIVDTTIIWTFSGIAIALMTIPNIIGILLLRKEMKSEVRRYWQEMDFSRPDK